LDFRFKLLNAGHVGGTIDAKFADPVGEGTAFGLKRRIELADTTCESATLGLKSCFELADAGDKSLAFRFDGSLRLGNLVRMGPALCFSTR
jgi:hypothetical protein